MSENQHDDELTVQVGFQNKFVSAVKSRSMGNEQRDAKDFYLSFTIQVSQMATCVGFLNALRWIVLQLASRVEVFQTLGHTNRHGLLSLAYPDSGVEVLLVGLVLSIWVADLRQEVVLLLENVIPDTGEVSILQVCVEVDLDDTVRDGVQELLLGRSRSAVEDEEDGLVLLGSDGILDVLLVLAEELGVELDVAGLVDTVDVTEASSNGEVWRDWGESLVDGKDILGLGVERVVVHILIVDTIFLSTSDTDLL